MEIFDIHHHLGSLTGGSLQEEAGWQDRDYNNRVRIMQANGVTTSAILAATGYIQADGIKDTMRSNDTVAAYRKRDPRRFPVACGTVEPLHGARSLGELERMKHELHLAGVVWHNRFQGVAIDHQLMRPLLKKVSELGLLPIVHTNAESNMEAVWRLAIRSISYWHGWESTACAPPFWSGLTSRSGICTPRPRRATDPVWPNQLSSC